MKFLVAVSLIVVAYSCVGAKDLPPSPRIVNGTEVADNAYPFQVSVQMYGYIHSCGGAIITPNYVVSAAHCNKEVLKNGTLGMVPASFFRVRVGSALHASGGQLVPIAEIIWHPDYSQEHPINDIALWRLETPLIFSKSINAIRIAAPPPPGSEVTVVGWGDVYEGSPTPPRMLEATMYAMSNEACRAYTGNETDGILCLAREGRTGICNGDSGGAAIYENTLVGLTSFSLEKETDLCLSTKPDMFANVSHYVDWLKKNSNL